MERLQDKIEYVFIDNKSHLYEQSIDLRYDEFYKNFNRTRESIFDEFEDKSIRIVACIDNKVIGNARLFIDEEKNAEMCVTLNSLRLYEELELTGGLLRVNGKVVAFTLGEEVSDDTFVVHIEKAFAEIQGAYPMINQQFVEYECMKYKYINREEDTGAEGLRKAKLSYRPVFLVEKGTVTKREATV